MVLWWNPPINAWPLITSNSSYMVVEWLLLQAMRKPRPLILISSMHANSAGLIIWRYFLWLWNTIDNCTWPAMGQCVPAILSAEIFPRPIHGNVSLLAKKEKQQEMFGREREGKEKGKHISEILTWGLTWSNIHLLFLEQTQNLSSASSIVVFGAWTEGNQTVELLYYYQENFALEGNPNACLHSLRKLQKQ